LNNLSQFWQELKRRKVVRVITVYAAAAFVILELVDIIAEPFGLPDWTLKLVVVLLSIGLIVSVILSWIYDVSPVGGLEKTKPAQKALSEGKQVSSGRWKIASYISFVVIVGLIVLNIISHTNNKSIEVDILEKSIAVLPFINDSEDKANEYFIKGIMEEVLISLQAIQDFKVHGRTSVEQYRNADKSVPEIATELGVNYIVAGSGQKYGNTFILRVQLLEGKNGMQLWGKSFEEEIESIEVITNIQSGIAESIAIELQAVITPEEKQIIEKPPTSNLTAYDFYQRGREEYWRFRLNRESGTALEKAEYFYNKALENDPGYASAFAGLAMVYYSKYLTNTRSGDQYSADYYRSVNLDSMNLLAQRAMDHDDQIADAYFAKGVYEQERGNLKEGLENMNDALKINPNHIMALMGAASIYGDLYDFVKGLSMLHKAASMERGSLLPVIYLQLYYGYSAMGFPKKSLQYLDEYLSLTGDSITYFNWRYAGELPAGNQEKANKYAAAAYEVDSSNQDAILNKGRSNLDSKRYEEAYRYYSRYFNLVKASGELDVNDMNRMGHVLWMTGRKEEAQHYFQEMIYHCKRHIEINSSYGRRAASFDLAGVYAFLGEKDTAYYYLEQFSRTNFQTYYVIDWLNFSDPLFESIRQEDRFQKLLRDMEDKCQAEHERVRQWLEENDML
jgi:TolB-like protein/Tfp pilus assembly protein PilF